MRNTPEEQGKVGKCVWQSYYWQQQGAQQSCRGEYSPHYSQRNVRPDLGPRIIWHVLASWLQTRGKENKQLHPTPIIFSGLPFCFQQNKSNLELISFDIYSFYIDIINNVTNVNETKKVRLLWVSEREEEEKTNRRRKKKKNNNKEEQRRRREKKKGRRKERRKKKKKRKKMRKSLGDYFKIKNINIINLLGEHFFLLCGVWCRCEWWWDVSFVVLSLLCLFVPFLSFFVVRSLYSVVFLL